MKRDMDLLRDMLLRVENSTGKPGWKTLTEGMPEEEAKRAIAHLELAKEAGLIKGASLNLGGHSIIENVELTWSGHEFLDSVRDPEVWDKAKEGASKAGSASVEFMWEIAKVYGKQLIKERLGIDMT